MKKSTKIWLIVAISLIVVGGAVFTFAMAYIGFDFTKLSTVKYETSTHEISEAFDSISVDVDIAEVIIARSTDSTCRIKCRENEKAKHIVSVADGKLTVKVDDTRKWYEHIVLLSFTSPTVTVYLPEEEYKSLYIETATGDVEIPSSFRFEDVTVSGRTADIECAVSADTLELTTATGDIELTGIEAKSVKLSATTGDIELDGVIAESLNIKTSTGDVEFDRCDADDITVRTSTGSVEGTLLSEKIFITETSTGRVKVPQGNSGGKCSVTTSTGDIEIEIE